MISHNDTIAAVSTPPGIGGISVIRISGADCAEILEEIFKTNISTKEMQSHHIYYGKIFDDNSLIDEVLVSVFKKPKSFTGEDVLEISCHGGSFVTQRVLQTILKNGARHAEKGEFTKRAFLNGKIDLTEAEAVIDLIQASTKHSLESALFQLEGKLHHAIKLILDDISTIRSEIELDIDFSDQGLEHKKYEDYHNILKEIKARIKRLIATAHEGLILHDGYRVVIAGPPNAGKSSVFNKIIENERAIVTEIPGTTRDYIEEDIALEGYLVKIFDTAGLRERADEIERFGIEKAYKILKNAHLILWIEDCTVSRETSIPSFEGTKFISVLNKSDLIEKKEIEAGESICVSAKTGNGIQELKHKIIDNIDVRSDDLSDGLITNSRQLGAAEKSLNAINQAIETTKAKRGLEFIAFDLHEASEYLEEIIGKISSEDIINSIFDRFCVGK
jgi:tRNA modification GTPase